MHILRFSQIALPLVKLFDGNLQKSNPTTAFDPVLADAFSAETNEVPLNSPSAQSARSHGACGQVLDSPKFVKEGQIQQALQALEETHQE